MAAVLLAQLSRLQQQVNRWRKHMDLLDSWWGKMNGIKVLNLSKDVSIRPTYGYYFRYLGKERHGIGIAQFAEDLQCGGVPTFADMYLPVYRSPEFGWRDDGVSVNYDSVSCPVAEKAAAEELLWIPHMVFLAGPRHIKRIAAVISRVLAGYQKT